MNMTRLSLPGIGFLILAVISPGVRAQDMDTERPGQTIPAETVPIGVLQMEAGFIYQADKLADTRLHDITPVSALFRMGLLERIELRAGIAYFHRNYTTTDNSHHEFSYIEKGLYPVLLGMKIHLLENQGIIPSLSIAGSLSFPSLSTKKYAPDHVAPDFRVIASYHLYENVTTTYNLGLVWDGKNDLPTFVYTAMLGVSHSERFYSFYELYGFIPPEAVAADVRLDAGLTWLLLNRFQVDFSGGVGLTQYAPDFYLGCGLSWRILE